MPQKRRKKRRLGISENGIARRSARGVNDVWCMDFVHDSDERGRSLRWLTIVNEFTRECVALEVARSMTSDDVRDILVSMFKTRGVPKHIWSDNGPKFIARTMRSFLKFAGIDALYIEPGSPWQNGIAESFNGRFRDELLNAEISRTSMMPGLSARIGAMDTTTNGHTARSGILPQRALRRHVLLRSSGLRPFTPQQHM